MLKACPTSSCNLTLGNLGAHAVWSPDGKRVAFATSRDQQTVYSRNADGSGSEESLGKSGHPYIPSDWSLDGRTLAVTRGFPNTDVWLLTVEGKKEERPFQTAAYGAVFSPDGRWIAYTASAAGGIDQVLVRPASGSGGALQVTSEGGTSPAWAGRELFFARGGKILVLETSTEPSFQAGPARVLFEAPFELETAPLRNYDVSRDGRRFVFVRGVSDSRWREIHLDLNWADELARLSPISAK